MKVNCCVLSAVRRGIKYVYDMAQTLKYPETDHSFMHPESLIIIFAVDVSTVKLHIIHAVVGDR